MKLHLAELRRRGVFKTLAGYAVASWVLIEVTSVIAPAFLLPDWAVATLTTVLVLGAFPVLLLSWRYEFTLEGIKLDTRSVPDEFERSARSITALILVLLLAITASLWVNYFRAQTSSEVENMLAAQQGAPEIAADGQIRSIAVLPFADFSPGGGQGLLADGIAEAILHVLAQNKDLVVTSRTSSFMFRDRAVSAAEIGRILNVQVLLEGSVQIINDRLRVTSQLIRTSDQAHIWSNVYEAPLDDMFKINDEIAYEVRALVLPDSQPQSDLQQQPHPPSVEAFQLLLEAREQIGEPEATDLAIRLLNVIVGMWPDYSDAWAWLAMANKARTGHLVGSHLASMAEVDKSIDETLKAADKALELNPQNHLAMLIRGWSSPDRGQSYHQAIGKVFELAPNDPQVLKWLGGLMTYSAAYEEAEQLLFRARAVEPSDYGILFYYLLSSCGNAPQTPIVETQLQDYPVSRDEALSLRSLALYCDNQFVEFVRITIKLIRIDDKADSVVRLLVFLAAVQHEKALELMGPTHRIVPGEFASVTMFNPSYFTQILPERLETYRRLTKIGLFNSSGSRQMYAETLIMKGDYVNAEVLIDRLKTGWDSFYAAEEGGRFWQSKTFTIYAYKAWLLAQRGQMVEASAMAEELMQGMEERNISEWSGSRGRLDDVPLMILLQAGRLKPAVNWLLDAEMDQWLHFQPLLTSPVYAEFREIPEVELALQRMVAWRTDLLNELMATGLPEVQNPSILLELLESRVRPTHHELAQMALHFDENPAAALDHYERALENDPDNPAILEQVADLALEYGLVDEAIALNERTVSLSPMEPYLYYSLSFSYACALRWSDAVASIRSSLELDPENAYIQQWLGMALILNGEPQAAMDVMQQIPDGWRSRMGLVLAHYALGQQAESDVLLAEWIEESGKRKPFDVAYTLAFRGDTDLAFEWLGKAATSGDGVSMAAVHPFLLKLHDDPRWLPFLQSIGKSPEQLAGFEFNLKQH